MFLNDDDGYFSPPFYILPPPKTTTKKKRTNAQTNKNLFSIRFVPCFIFLFLRNVYIVRKREEEEGGNGFEPKRN